MRNPHPSHGRPLRASMALPLLLVTLLLALGACNDDISVKPVKGGAADRYEGSTGDNTWDTASSLPLGQPQLRTIFPPADEDWVMVNLTTGGNYEFSANKLGLNEDVVLELYDALGTTQLAINNDYFFKDSRIQFIAPATGPHYLRVTAFDTTYGTAGYTLTARTFVDADGDTISSYYDCNDANIAIHPAALEIEADGIDQNCDGADAPSSGAMDAKELDNTILTAKPFAQTFKSPLEFLYVKPQTTANIRSHHNGTDEDWFVTTAVNNEFKLIFVRENNGGIITPVVYESDGTTIHLSSPNIYNISGATATYYVQFSSVGAQYYVPVLVSAGTDADMDGQFTKGLAPSRDCNDNDNTIFSGAPETAADGVDSNCNGQDDT